MAPNDALRAARLALRLSQDEFAAALVAAGAPGANKRLVQRWEAGVVAAPRSVYARALEAVTRTPIELLGFAGPVGRPVDDGRGGHNVTMPPLDELPDSAQAGRARPVGTHTGVWLSRYEYYLSSRGQMHSDLHYVLILQHGEALSVRSLPGTSPSLVTMDLTVDGSVVTGTWRERTNPEGHYRGATYHGAIQMIVEPTGRRMAGKWAGFGREMEINTGPWELVFQDASTSRATLERYGRPPVD